ncbi:MAG: 5'/3'-nucleotidase SurE [Gammaproteobacteria bacterium]|nr:5'/3'-nucleotidase SurE [Gammaproteobacteria bacterium]
MKILLSNDDGYYSKGITGLAESLKQFADVTIVAPENNCSGLSSSLTLKNPLRIRKFQDNGYYVNGTPADCVFLALTKVLDKKPDLLVSGINHGANLGDDVLYSGTVGAAMGGRFSNIPCLALSSTSLKPKHLDAAIEASKIFIRDHLTKLTLRSTVLNINFPDVPIEEMKGYTITELGKRLMPDSSSSNIDAYGDEIHWIGPPPPPENSNQETDFNAIANNKISITPLATNLTDSSQINDLKDWIDKL